MKLWRCLKQMRRMQQQESRNTAQNTYFVPFRESKLTHLLMNHLSGAVSGRTMMIVNSSSAAADYDETSHVLENSALAQSVAVIKNEDRAKKYKRGNKAKAQYDQHGRKIRKRKADKSSEELKIASTSTNGPKFEAGGSCAFTPEEINSLKGENQTLRKSVEQLKENLAKQEAEIRKEVAKEMAAIMESMHQQYQQSNMAEDAQGQSVCMSSRKVHVGALQKYINELEERNTEAEEELVRMQASYKQQIDALKEQIKELQSHQMLDGNATQSKVIDLSDDSSEILMLRQENESLKAELEQSRKLNVPYSAGSTKTEDEFELELEERKKRDARFKRIKHSPQQDHGVSSLSLNPGKKKENLLDKVKNMLSPCEGKKQKQLTAGTFPLSPHSTNDDNLVQRTSKPLFHPGRSDKENISSTSSGVRIMRTRSQRI